MWSLKFVRKRQMTVELNAAFVPQPQRRKLETYLRKSWHHGERVSRSLRVRWEHQDPGFLVIAVSLGEIRIEHSSKCTCKDATEEEALRLVAMLAEEIHRFLLVQ